MLTSPVSDASPPTIARRCAKLGGNANLATLDSRGVLALFSKHQRNQFWTFKTGDADVAATELHSPDGSLFNLIFPGAADRAVVDESAQL